MEAQPQSPIDWFEIPVRDMDRAQKFYEVLLDTPMHRETMGEQTLGLFSFVDRASGAA